MRIRAGVLALSGIFFGLYGAVAVAQDANQIPECKSNQVPQKIIENGKPVIRCVKRPGMGTASAQFKDFIRGNRFHHGKHTYTFCTSSRYQANSARGTYKVARAKRVKSKSGRVTITANIVLRASSGKRSTLKAVLAKSGLKINGEKFGFGGPAPPNVTCAPK
jgi:hypothetical protein